MSEYRDIERRAARWLNMLQIICWAIAAGEIAMCIWLACAIIWNWEIF